MNRRQGIAAAMALGLLWPGLAEAAPPPSSGLTSMAEGAGILPTSPFYGLKRLVESVELLVSFSPSAKAKLYLNFAKLRADEAAAMWERHQTALAASMETQYGSDLSLAEHTLPTALSSLHDPASHHSLLELLVSDATSGATLAKVSAAHGTTLPTDVRDTVKVAEEDVVVTDRLSNLGAPNPKTLSATLDAMGTSGEATDGFITALLASAADTTSTHVAKLFEQDQKNWALVADNLGLTLADVLNALGGSAPAPNPGPPSSPAPPTSGTSQSGSSSSSTPPSSSGSGSPPTSSSSGRPSEPPPRNPTPESEAEQSLWGTVSQVTPTSIVVNGTSYALAPAVAVHYNDATLTVSQIADGSIAHLDIQGGLVTTIDLTSDPGVPSGESLSGTLTAVTSSTITVGGYTVTLAAGVPVSYHDFTLTEGALKPGETLKVSLDGSGAASRIQLLNDPNLPPGDSYTGTVGGVTGSSIAVGPYSLPLSGYVAVSYGDFELTLGAVTPGITVQVNLGSAGTVNQIQIQDDPALPDSGTVTGPIQNLTGSSITVDGYTLALASPSIQFQDQPYSGTLEQGWTVKLKLNRQAAVDAITIQQGPPGSGGN